MNDPNGLVLYKNIYHMFYQYYPDSTVWGPMHWGHATSTDLMRWQEQPIALYPDSLGYIFSGSVVADVNNTSKLGNAGKPPLVAVFTYHNPAGEKSGRNDFQSQGLAYSVDDGNTWTKYRRNPVLTNPGISDFRDPKVMWDVEYNKWIMTLAVKNKVSFYSSTNLKKWNKESDFGSDKGAHGGVWECPDLIKMNYEGNTVWVLLVSINPGGPNGGSATQYFVGDFNGKTFKPFDDRVRWLDYGPDQYAGVTFSNTGNKNIFLGWMSNWSYAQKLPTKSWRSAMTLPRELGIEKNEHGYIVTSKPVNEVERLAKNSFRLSDIVKGYTITQDALNSNVPYMIEATLKNTETFSIQLMNDARNQLVIGFNGDNKEFYIDRTAAGEASFDSYFAAVHTAPRLSDNKRINLTIIVDVSSVEFFADDGFTVMTELCFPKSILSKVDLEPGKNEFIDVKYTNLKSAWK